MTKCILESPALHIKQTIYTEAKAAVRGGVTSFMEMPNTNPPAFTHELLEQKYDIAKNHALANYSFFMGTSNDNLEEVLRTNDKKKDICGVKIFMGSSTGNLLVDNPILLERIFEGSEVLIATHCEEERLIKQNLAKAAAENRKLTAKDHPIIRDEEVCFESSFRAVQMAKKFGTRLHILHITTAKELQLFSNMLPLEQKRITSEVCVHHLHFTSDDYAKLGNQIKCNPAIKAPHNKTALWEGLLDNRLDIYCHRSCTAYLGRKTRRLYARTRWASARATRTRPYASLCGRAKNNDRARCRKNESCTCALFSNQ